MSAEHDELIKELDRNRAFEVLERQARHDNVVTLNEGNRAVAKMNLAAAELNKARARFWRSLGTVLMATWAAALITGEFWVILHILR